MTSYWCLPTNRTSAMPWIQPNSQTELDCTRYPTFNGAFGSPLLPTRWALGRTGLAIQSAHEPEVNQIPSHSQFFFSYGKSGTLWSWVPEIVSMGWLMCTALCCTCADAACSQVLNVNTVFLLRQFLILLCNITQFCVFFFNCKKRIDSLSVLRRDLDR